MDKLFFRLLVWIWIRRAKKAYGGPGEMGEIFNTACFQSAVGKTTGRTIVSQAAKEILIDCGYAPGYGGCHWFNSFEKAHATTINKPVSVDHQP